VCQCVYEWKIYKGCADDKLKGSGIVTYLITDNASILETLVTDGTTEFTGKHTDFIKQA
jgi:hypothetical protein